MHPNMQRTYRPAWSATFPARPEGAGGRHWAACTARPALGGLHCAAGTARPVRLPRAPIPSVVKPGSGLCS
jgi:hypothetical protein